jgi:hypothetical protein
VVSTKGSFSSVFSTLGLTFAGSPYRVIYSYPGDAHYNAINTENDPDPGHRLIIEPESVGVGGEVDGVNKPGVLAPWLAAVLLISGGIFLISRRGKLFRKSKIK